MCGICGVILRQGLVDSAMIERMRDIMAYRGPDDCGLFVSKDRRVGLGHRRLSIIDLATGTQPMTCAFGCHTIVFNGEIYNYLELKAEFEDYPFRTGSDTEVILAAYERHGSDSLNTLNGMFAFAIHDARSGSLLLARDSAGIKPLYYYDGPEGFFFASEIKAILAGLGRKLPPDLRGVADYLTFQYTLDDRTMFQSVRKLAPGHWLRVDVQGLSQGRFFEYDFSRPEIRYEDAVESFDAIFTDAVRIQLRADVPVGCHLSGGLDTGLIAAKASRLLGGSLQAFTAGFAEGGIYDDTAYALITARHVGAEPHVVHPTREQLIEMLPKLLWHMDEPAAGEGLFPQYCVSRLAASQVKVVLGGQGADETQGGYIRYFLLLWLRAMTRAVHGQATAGDAFDLETLAPCLPQLKNYWPLWRQAIQGAPWPDAGELLYRMIVRAPALENMLVPEALRALDGYSPRAGFDVIFSRPGPNVDDLDKVLYFETTQWLPALLQVEDRMSMACSLESRVPFLDTRLLRMAFRMPGRIKMRDGRTKSLLREVAARELPEAIHARRDKIGFPVPLAAWGGQELMRELLGEVPAELAGMFRQDYLNACMGSGTPGDRRLWGLLCLSLWWKTFIG